MLKMKGLESSSDNLYQSWRDILLNCQKTRRKTIVLTSGVNPFALIIVLKEMVMVLLLKLLL
jgi:hypothetical protein